VPVSLPFTLDLVLAAAHDSYTDFKTFKLIPYDKTIIDRVLADPKTLPDLQRSLWRFKDEKPEQKSGFGKDYVKAMKTKAAKYQIELSDEEVRALLAFSVSAGAVHWQNGTFGMSGIFLDLLFRNAGFTISPMPTTHLKSKKLDPISNETSYGIVYEITSTVIGDANEQKPIQSENALVRLTSNFILSNQNNVYKINSKEAINVLEIEHAFYNNVLLPRVKKTFESQMRSRRSYEVLNVKDFFDYMPFLVDDDFAKMFAKKMVGLTYDGFLLALRYIDHCYQHHQQRKLQIFDLLYKSLSEFDDQTAEHKFELARRGLKQILQDNKYNKDQKTVASEVLDKINSLSQNTLATDLKLYTKILYCTSQLVKNPNDTEHFLEYEALIQTQVRHQNISLLKAAMTTLLGVTILAFAGMIITAAIAMPPLVLGLGIILTSALVIKTSMIVGGLLGCGAIGSGLYGIATVSKPLNNVITSSSSFWQKTNNLYNQSNLMTTTAAQLPPRALQRS
jgi:hypothetical protein